MQDNEDHSPSPIEPDSADVSIETSDGATPDVEVAVAEGAPAAADLPTMADLDGVADEVQRVEATLPLLDKKNSPMCPNCQSAFADADASTRMELLACSCS